MQRFRSATWAGLWLGVSFPAFLTLGCVTTAPLTPGQRAMLAQDVRDALSLARPWLGDEVMPYLEAAEPLLQAFVSGGDVSEAMWQSVRDAEPMLRAALVKAGRTDEEAESIVAGVRLVLRRIEFVLASQPATSAEVQ